MENKTEKRCPQCGNHCPKDNLHCPRGAAYFGVEFKNAGKEITEDMPIERKICLLLEECGHIAGHAAPKIGHAEFLSMYSDAEKAALLDMLTRMFERAKEIRARKMGERR